MMKFNRKQEKINNILSSTLWDLPSPSSMTYFWNFGSTLGICLVIQILTGLLLSLHYTSWAEQSFQSTIEIMREMWEGWLIRFMHMNGASVFFAFIYLHLFRGLYFMSSVHKEVWMSGVTIMIMLMSISFLGYVLPWGQMSYWAVAVITNLLSIVPMIGNNLVQWIWGGYSVSSPTLIRFYSFHFLLPFILTFMVLLHLYLLHQEGSSTNLGTNSNLDKIQFHPYFSVKDYFYIIGVITISMSISFYEPYMLGDSVNNIPANPMQTPIHIQPEWYFLPSYAILRALPSKAAGVVALLASVSMYYILPTMKFKFPPNFDMKKMMIFWIFIFNFLFLMKMGMSLAEEPYILSSKISTMVFFWSLITMNM